MPVKDPKIYLRDILNYCDRITRVLADKSLEDFRFDIDCQDAVARRFEIIGEAVKRVSEKIKNQYTHIPWKKAADFRDVLIHDYPEVIIDQVYITGKEHLPEFRNQIQEVLNRLENL